MGTSSRIFFEKLEGLVSALTNWAKLIKRSGMGLQAYLYKQLEDLMGMDRTN